MYNVLTGAQLYSIRSLTKNAESMDAALKAISEMGYTSVQLSGHNPEIDPAAIKDMLDKYGLIAPSTHVGFNELEDNFEAAVARHKLWGVPYPGIGGMPGEFRDSAEGIREFARRANIVGKKLKDEGMTFVYHNHAFEFARFGAENGMDILFNELTDVQFELDVFWVQTGGGNPVDWIRKVAGRMDVVHFKEMVGCAPDPVTHSMSKMAPVGEGNFDWQKIMQACDETGVKYAFIEQDNAVDTDPLCCMKTSINNLTRLGGRFK